jgi:transcriptional regulator of nitric oxide reductase
VRQPHVAHHRPISTHTNHINIINNQLAITSATENQKKVKLFPEQRQKKTSNKEHTNLQTTSDWEETAQYEIRRLQFSIGIPLRRWRRQRVALCVAKIIAGWDDDFSFCGFAFLPTEQQWRE